MQRVLVLLTLFTIVSKNDSYSEYLLWPSWQSNSATALPFVHIYQFKILPCHHGFCVGGVKRGFGWSSAWCFLVFRFFCSLGSHYLQDGCPYGGQMGYGRGSCFLFPLLLDTDFTVLGRRAPTEGEKKQTTLRWKWFLWFFFSVTRRDFPDWQS